MTTNSNNLQTTSNINQDNDEAINSFLSFTNTKSKNDARIALNQANGNLETAIENYFDSNLNKTNNNNNNNSSNLLNQQEKSFENLSLDDSSQSDHGFSSRARNQPPYQSSHQPRRNRSKLIGFFFRLCMGPLKLFAVPVSFVADLGLTVFSLLGRLLGLRLPTISFHWPRPSSFGWISPASRTDPRTAAERWVRELEEELHARSSYTTAQPGDLVMPRLPDFLLLGYDDAVKMAKEHLKVLMVVLISREHDDTNQFKRITLMDEGLLAVVRNNNILVWGGDVKDQDASFAAQVLDATTFPFVAFVSLQAKRPSSTITNIGSTSNRSSANLMTVCTRLEGSPHHTTSAASIITTINSVVLPRTTAYLNRLKAEKIRREADRRLREEQDRAYAEAGRLDRERVMKKKAEIEAESKRNEELRLKKLASEKRRKEKLEEMEQKRRWRYWSRQERMPKEPSSGGVTIGFRLGNGRRVIRKFEAEELIDSLYLFVEVEFGAGSEGSIELPRPREDYIHSYAFKLSTAMPRRILPVPQTGAAESSKKATISDFGGLDGANVNVEGSFMEVSSDEEEGDDE
ncbi:hypothetical protein O181_034252 [Austropuccinia psidii MF-1]|uniref:UBX domain-containing protein n=1 Tax=Austropuccinia psidii MF-1 TaxID=1389203 RepID=A0A9Q3D683_9BASI|nr:hypothetical protein [Austropuccinia psidii MF-1]